MIEQLTYTTPCIACQGTGVDKTERNYTCNVCEGKGMVTCKLDAIIPAVKQPYRCPVCGGSGIVPNGFYNQTTGNWTTTDATPDVCRSCSGRGIVWEPLNLNQ